MQDSYHRQLDPKASVDSGRSRKGQVLLRLGALNTCILGCSEDLVSRLSKGPSWASYGLLWGPIGDTRWTY